MAPVDDIAATLWYVHDPMCSWCWAFVPAWQRLRASLPESVTIRRVVGGLAPDSDVPMPADMQQSLQQTWRRIERQVPGTVFNHEFWQRCRPRRSTYPACRAVVTARTLDPMLEEAMIAAIQHAYYLEARNPSDLDTLVDLADQIGLDLAAFSAEIGGERIAALFEADLARARGMGADSFPSLLLETPGTLTRIPIDYLADEPMAAAIEASLRA